jgi:hypothetical protein
LGKVLSKLVADVLGLKNNFRITEAEVIVNTVFEKDLGFNFDHFLDVKESDFITYLQSKSFDLISMEELANLFFEIGSSSNHLEKKQKCFSKATLLFNYLNDQRKTFSFDFMTKLNAMKNLYHSNENSTIN